MFALFPVVAFSMKAEELAAVLGTVKTVQAEVPTALAEAVTEGVKKAFAEVLPQMLEEGRQASAKGLTDSLWAAPPDSLQWSLNSL